jgi:glutamyl-tRNA reductase
VKYGLSRDLESFQACTWQIASLPRAQFAAAQATAESHAADGGAMLLMTCQRLEAYHFGSCACTCDVHLAGREALYHLAEVAAGLHAVVPGEDQVLGQVRYAIHSAPAVFRGPGDLAMSSARQFRRTLEFETDAGHVLDRALGMLDATPEGLLLVLGAGHMGRLVARRGLALGFAQVIVASRQRPSASWFGDPRLSWVALERLHDIPGASVIAGCLGADAGQLSPDDDLPPARALVDLGTPRNFAPASASCADIATLLEAEAGDASATSWRAIQVGRVRALVDARLDFADSDDRSGVRRLRSAIERQRVQEADRIATLHPEIPRETVDAITRSLLNRIFHAPSERLRQLGDDEFARELAALFLSDPAAEDEE